MFSPMKFDSEILIISNVLGSTDHTLPFYLSLINCLLSLFLQDKQTERESGIEEFSAVSSGKVKRRTSPLSELLQQQIFLFRIMAEVDLYTQYKGVYLPAKLHPPQSLQYYEEFTFRPDDILIVTYPKSGEWLLFYMC